MRNNKKVFCTKNYEQKNILFKHPGYLFHIRSVLVNVGFSRGIIRGCGFSHVSKINLLHVVMLSFQFKRDVCVCFVYLLNYLLLS